MVAIYGKEYAHCQNAWNTICRAIRRMNGVAGEYKKRYNLNFAILATPCRGTIRTIHQIRQKTRHYPQRPTTETTTSTPSTSTRSRTIDIEEKKFVSDLSMP